MRCPPDVGWTARLEGKISSAWRVGSGEREGLEGFPTLGEVIAAVETALTSGHG
jgi:hypothetical protein